MYESYRPHIVAHIRWHQSVGWLTHSALRAHNVLQMTVKQALTLDADIRVAISEAEAGQCGRGA